NEHYISSERTAAIFGDPPRDNWRYHIKNDWYVNIEAADKTAAEASLANYVAAVEGRAPRYDMIHPYRRPSDGRIIWVHVLGQVVRNERGEPTHVYGVVMDITESKKNQENLVRAEKMAALGGLVAGVAHEINTPVGIALTSASHLAKETGKVVRLYEAGELGSSDFEDYVQVATEATRLLVSNCNRAADMIRSFKQVAVDQTGGECRLFQLREYIDEILLSLKPRLKKTLITVDVDCPPDIFLDTNPGLLSQSLTNLVMNSIFHAFDDGATAGRITIKVSQPTPDEVEIRFTDDGKGIPVAIRDKIFDPFFTTRRGDGGSGLGLHIVYNAVSGGLKGTIMLDGASDRGTTFIIRIPKMIS
ncbi:MAG: PAS domain S-box protein, partial [Alphaproteobacteria bacterium]|nr:PAS domain S-box protein [Alphaproteobacteria bacterium]